MCAAPAASGRCKPAPQELSLEDLFRRAFILRPDGRAVVSVNGSTRELAKRCGTANISVAYKMLLERLRGQKKALEYPPTLSIVWFLEVKSKE